MKGWGCTCVCVAVLGKTLGVSSLLVPRWNSGHQVARTPTPETFLLFCPQFLLRDKERIKLFVSCSVDSWYLTAM